LNIRAHLKAASRVALETVAEDALDVAEPRKAKRGGDEIDDYGPDAGDEELEMRMNEKVRALYIRQSINQTPNVPPTTAHKPTNPSIEDSLA
jgi:hypothetical protein